VRQGGVYAIVRRSVGHYVCLCMQDYYKYIISRFHWNLVLWLSLQIGRTD